MACPTPAFEMISISESLGLTISIPSIPFPGELISCVEHEARTAAAANVSMFIVFIFWSG